MRCIFIMKTKIYILFTALLIFLPYLNAQDDIINHFLIADSLCNYPELQQPIDTICVQQIPQYLTKNVGGKTVTDTSKFYVSFLGYAGQKQIFIAAITLKPLEKPNSDILRIVDFDETSPRLGRVSTWGYVFDRNNDGKIDYMALVDGAAPFKDDNVPEDFPVRGQNLTLPELEMYMSKCRIIFNHWADDNFDGQIDAVIHTDMDPVRDWVDRRLVIRGTKFDGKFNNVWAFRNLPIGDREKIEYSETSVPYRPLGKLSGQITPAMFEEKTAILSLLNRAASRCDIGKDIQKY